MNEFDPEFKKTIEAQLNQLPKKIKDIILAGEWKQWVGNIVKKNTLNLDQASSLEAEIFIFLIGLAGIFDLRKAIEKELAIPVSKVNDIMIDINDMIVEPLKQKLMDATSDEEDEPKGVPAAIAKHIELGKKEEEILDRQKILDEIEQNNHSPEVGVFTPDKSYFTPSINVQPIAQNAQVNSAKANPMLANVIPVTKPAMPVQKAPENIFEAKTQGVVASESTRSAVVVTEKKSGSDVYREMLP
jgi:hypothetical protein